MNRRIAAWFCVLLLGLTISGCQRPKTTGPEVGPTASMATAAAVPEVLTIATFNIENLGVAKMKKKDIVATLVDIVRKYDIVAVQEITDASLQTPTRFLAEINADSAGDRYAVLASPRTGRQPADRTSQEQYAFYYNTRTVSLVDEGGLFPDDAANLFRREPMAAQFATIDGKMSVVLVTIHTDPDVASKEIAALRKVHDWAEDRFSGETGLVILGDFNAGVAYTKRTELDRIRNVELPFRWVVPDNADTTLARNPQAHDRIIVCGKLESQYRGRWGVDRSFETGRVSDHWPTWFELGPN